jgi:hypothetical protein
LILSLAVQCGMAQVIVTQPLVCVVHNTSAATDELTWDMANTNACGTFAGYVIYRSNSQGGSYLWDTLITDINATSWIDLQIAGGNQYWYYYVKDSFNCPGATYQIADTVNNASNPNIPALDYVTVNADSTITFHWLPSTSPQTRYYVIYIIEPNGNKVIQDTVYGRLNTTWTDPNPLDNPYAASITYSVSASDSCPGNLASSVNTYPLSTILLSYGEARCNPAIPFSWTKYNYMYGGVGGYNIYVSRNDSAYQLVGTVDSTTLTFNYTTFNNGDSVQVHIVAISATDSTIQSSSNYLRFIATVIKPPAFVYLTWLSVDTTNNTVDARWIVDNNAKVFEYQLYNSEDETNWARIPDANNGIEQVPVPVARFASYADSTVQPQFGPYFYYVQAYDSCQTYSISPPGEIISLQASLSDYYQITLNWNHFELFGANVIRQDLYRDVGNGMFFDHSFDSSATTYIDSVFQDTALAGAFCYLIKATYVLNLPLANNYDTTEITYSNIACVDHRPIIYIPNAFVYNGTNNFFKPRIIFGDPAGYDMTIWDRYGGKIFETHDPNGSWDGTNDGHTVEQGGYAYLITFTALDGTPVSRSGIVMFLKK